MLIIIFKSKLQAVLSLMVNITVYIKRLKAVSRRKFALHGWKTFALLIPYKIKKIIKLVKIIKIIFKILYPTKSFLGLRELCSRDLSVCQL